MGGGGFAGVISYGAMMTALGRGYATASTDTGHNTPGGSWALNRPDLIVDFAYRAIHEMTVKSKVIVEAFYGNAPARSYFVGCSTGGRQGLMEAQRFPADYDGIIAGAPANYWTHLMPGTLWNAVATMKAEARLSPAKFAALNKGALAACDASDGVTDGLINNPLACKFDPATLACRGGSSDPPSDDCLTPPQIEAARKIYAGAPKIFPGMAPSSEMTWGATAGTQPFAIPGDFYKYFVYSNPDWEWKQFDFAKDVAAGDEKFGKVMNATDPDLSAFKERGGNLIMYHGWNDPSTRYTRSGHVSWFSPRTRSTTSNRFKERLATILRFAIARLHSRRLLPQDKPTTSRACSWRRACSTAPAVWGPNAFDAVTALEQWVEKGTKPAHMIASHTSNGTSDRTRPLCPYPQVATYKATGSIDEEISFQCR